jgi:conjugal transfer pilus assembly protein TraU
MKKVILGLFILSPLAALGDSWVPNNECPNQTSKVLSNICISCFFPIRLGLQIGSGGTGALPSDKYRSICACRYRRPPFLRIGLTGGVWSPVGIVEVTPREYCSSALGGSVAGSDTNNRGIGHWGKEITYNNVHYIPFPIAEIASLIMGIDSPCGIGDSGSALWSELDPTWNDPKLAAFKSPEGLPPGGDAPSAMAAIVIGCAAEFATMQFNSDYFGSRWCAGAYGQTYPLTGYAINSGNPATIAGLQYARLVDQMYKTGLQTKTWGTNDQVCKGRGSYQISTPKNGHRMQQVAPEGEKKNHRIGDIWSVSGGTILAQGNAINNNNYIFLDWKYKECCVR